MGLMRAAAQERLRQGRLPEMLRDPQRADKMVAVLAVHVRSAELATQLGEEDFTLQVKYGARTSCLRCETPGFTPEVPIGRAPSRQSRAALPCAEIGSLCLFRLYDPVLPVLRLSLRRSSRKGLGARTVAKGSTSIEHLSGRSIAEVPLQGGGGNEIGRVSVAFEILWVRRQDLATSLTLAGAQVQRDAYVISADVLTVVGDLVDESSGSQAGTSSAPR